MADNVIRARLDPTVKKKATRALKRMGLTTSGVLRLLMVRIAEEEKLPFEPLAPNKKTISAMNEARRAIRVAPHAGAWIETWRIDQATFANRGRACLNR